MDETKLMSLIQPQSHKSKIRLYCSKHALEIPQKNLKNKKRNLEIIITEVN